jgi:hypothetical protein
MAEIASILGLAHGEQLDKLGSELKKYGIAIRQTIRSVPNGFPDAPFNESNTQRIKWIENNILTPVGKLLQAFEEKNAPRLSLWPEDRRMPSTIASERFIEELAEVREKAATLHFLLAEQIEGKLAPNSELRYDIVSNLIASAIENYPDLKMSRGTYDKKLKAMIGQTPAYVRCGFKEITGLSEQLDEPTEQVLKSL